MKLQVKRKKPRYNDARHGNATRQDESQEEEVQGEALMPEDGEGWAGPPE